MLTYPQAIADRTAKHLGVRFYKKQMNERSLADRFKDATWHCEQPFADLNFIGTYALSELVRGQGFRVLLNGMLHIKSRAQGIPDFVNRAG
jgi:asparagine synthase (glutamine-hydrolysing)